MSETNNKVQHNDELEIDLMRLIKTLLSKWIIIALSGILGGTIAFGATTSMVTPMYRASSMIYILTQTTSVTSLSDLQMGTQLAQDFEVLATTRPVIEAVIEELDLDTSYGALVGAITVTNINSTRMLRLTVEHEDPVLATDISNALAEAVRVRVAEIMDTDKPTKVEEAVEPEYPYSPSTKKNTMIGAMLGMILVAGTITMLFLIDDTIKTSDDVAKYLNLNTLAKIPTLEQTEDEVKIKGIKKKRGK
ncbi:MAG: Wzz/FepE/Etk N-terminal domain-containing protein [Clostridia bacterium]